MAKKVITSEETVLNISIFNQKGEAVEHTCKTVDEAYKLASENGYQVSIS